MIGADELLTRLEGVKRAGSGWSAKCPAHEDHRASLSVAEGADGRLLLHCHAGCDLERILEVLGVDVRDLFPADAQGKAEILATYDYTDGRAAALQVVRYPQDFRQRRRAAGGEWEGASRHARVFTAPEVRKAGAAGRRVFVVGGEKGRTPLEAGGSPPLQRAGAGSGPGLLEASAGAPWSSAG